MKLLKNSLALLFFFSSFSVLSQSAFNLPLSINGLGEENPVSLSADAGLGGANVGLASTTVLNIGNPASYTQFFTQMADVGFTTTTRTFSFPSGDFTTSGGNFRNFFYGFPLGDRVGMLLGLRPYSTINYQFIEEQTTTDATIINSYEGNGGFNEVTMGFGVELWKDSLNILSIGANGHYLFGFRNKLLYTIISEPGSSNFNSRVQDRFNIRDVYADVGVQYVRRLNKRMDLVLGATYQPNRPLNAFGFSYAGTFSGTPNREAIKDTVLFTTDTGSVSLGNSISLGFSLELDQALVISGEYAFREQANTTLQAGNFSRNARSLLAFGIQYTPDYEEITKIFKIAKYRAGVRILETGLTYDNSAISEIGITFGLGLPLVKSQSLTSLNVGFMAGFRNNGAASTYSEQFNTFSVGVSIAPHKFDKWFLRRKID